MDYSNHITNYHTNRIFFVNHNRKDESSNAFVPKTVIYSINCCKLAMKTSTSLFNCAFQQIHTICNLCF